MSNTPPDRTGLSDLAAVPAQLEADLPDAPVDRDAVDVAVPGAGPDPVWPGQGTKPLPLHPPTTAPTQLRVRVELVDSTPPIWRSLVIPAHVTLEVLHDVLQVAFGFTNTHLHKFALTSDPVGREFVGILTSFDVAEGDNGVPEGELRVDQVLAAPGHTLLYLYDFGDYWEHLLTLEAVEPLADAAMADAATPAATPVPAAQVRCVAGERSGPAEDVGGVRGWEELLALSASGKVPYYSTKGERLRKLGLVDFVDEVDLAAINRGLARVAGAPAALEWLRGQPDGPVGASALTTLVARQHGGAQEVLAGYLAAAELTRPIDLGGAAEATAVIRAFLGLVGEGIRFTDAGYLPLAAVKEIMATLDVERRWRGPTDREVQTYPVLLLREKVTLLGLTRKYKRALVLTPKGRALRNDPVGLLTYLASRLPAEKTPAGSDVALLLLMLVAGGEAETRDALREQIDLLSSMIGLRYDDGGGRYGNLIAIQDAFDTLEVLEWAGLGQLMPPRDGDQSALSHPRARMLARLALITWA
jgi:hypothetical protein